MQGQVECHDAVATVLVDGGNGGGGIDALARVGLTVEVPGVAVELGGLKGAAGVGIDSVVDGDGAGAAVLGGPVGNSGTVVRLAVEGTGEGQVNGLLAVFSVDEGVVECTVVALRELVLAEGDFHLLGRGREGGEGQHVGRVATQLIGLAGSKAVGLNAGGGGSDRIIAEVVVLAEAYSAFNIVVALRLGADETQHLGTVAAVGGLREGERNVGVASGVVDVVDDGNEVVVGIVPLIWQTLVALHDGMVVAVVDSHVEAADNIAAVADGGLELIAAVLVDLAVDKAAVASHGVEDEDVAHGGVDPVQCVSGKAEDEIEDLRAVATSLVGDTRQQIADVAVGFVHVVGDTVDPGVGRGVAPADVVDSGVGMTEGEVEGHEAVATGHVGDGVLSSVVVLGVGNAVNPDELVARILDIDAGGRGTENEVHGHDAVALVDGLQVLCVGAGGGVLDVVPSVAVALVSLEGGGPVGVHGEVEVVLHRADIRGGVDVAQRGDVQVSDVAGLILALAEGEGSALAVGGVGVGDTGGGDVKVQVDSRVAAVGDTPGLVVVATVDVGEGLCTPGVGEHGLAYR